MKNYKNFCDLYRFGSHLLTFAEKMKISFLWRNLDNDDDRDNFLNGLEKSIFDRLDNRGC